MTRDGSGLPASALAAMGSALRHRGPDGVAVVEEAGYALGITRLGIVAPGEPVRVYAAPADPRVRAVHNGEIDNHRELRRRLQVDGGADSAVIPALHQALGDRAWAKLRGPGAVALVDEEGALHLVRDPLGKKPLYTAQNGGVLAFASEQKALVRAGVVAGRPSPAAAAFFLRHGMLPEGLPLCVGVASVPPGGHLVVDDNGVEQRRLRPWPGADRDAGDAALAALLAQAVERRRPRDVEGAVALSGGVDSTLVAALAAKHGVARAYTLAMPGHDESAAAADTARALGLAHVVVTAPAPSLAGLRRALFHLETPDAFSAWGMAPAALALSERVSADGVRVLLSGEGADEVFLGYPWQRAEAAGERGFDLGDDDVVTRYAGPGAALRLALVRQRAFHAGASPTALGSWLALQQPACDDVAARALALFPGARDVDSAWPRRHPAAPHGARGRQRDALVFEMQMLPVLHADRLYLARGVEVRMPFLDEDLVRAALRLPEKRLEAAAREKPRVHALAARLAPALAGDRPKRGFTAAARPGADDVVRFARGCARAGLACLDGDALAGEVRAAEAGDAVAVEVVWRALLLEEAVRAVSERAPPG